MADTYASISPSSRILLAKWQRTLGDHEARGDLAGAAEAHERIAGLFRQHNLPSQAQESYQRAIVLRDRLGDFVVASAILREMSDVYAQLGQLDDAFAMIQRSIAVRERLGNLGATADSVYVAGGLLERTRH